MTNGQGTDTALYTRNAHDIVAPAITQAVESPGEGEEVDPSLEEYVGRYDSSWGEMHALIKDGSLVLLYVPTQAPLRAMTKLKQGEADTFRRIRDDGALGEVVRFERDASGKIIRMWQNDNYSERVR
jgi:hypothetical protein